MSSEEFNTWWKELGCKSLFSDGASKGNPRLAGAGRVLFYSKGSKMNEYSWGIGKKTNNGVEWLALIKGLELARNVGIEELVIFGNSMMVIREARNLAKNRKNPTTKTYHILKYMINEFKAINFIHLLRANNYQANIIANKGVNLDCGTLVYNQKVYKRNCVP